MGSPPRLTPKRLQLCNVQIATSLVVQRNQVNLRLWQGHKCLKDNQQECKARVGGREQFLMKLGVADCSVVVVVLPHMSLEVTETLVVMSLDNFPSSVWCALMDCFAARTIAVTLLVVYLCTYLKIIWIAMFLADIFSDRSELKSKSKSTILLYWFYHQQTSLPLIHVPDCQARFCC
jgi:hypothetical protein